MQRPKGALTPALRDSIKQYKPDLLHLLESRPPTPTSNGRALPIISREGALPLSFSQERLWLLSKLDPDNHFTGNLPFAFRIKGAGCARAGADPQRHHPAPRGIQSPL
ncbi:MAG: hypothetical protein HZT40_09250 [Candidatus Thiothrix singaporensis]|uniref:Uncharacterized protein n=1 Tax=Candidatus Thiothrix singaporensis TaxID=2799669 RepID=A0A7L6ARJ5_9GAMM|nr:MAG: hypothetical protein HZT40_09250 [Candidatus Thiothrix singaporensis]